MIYIHLGLMKTRGQIPLVAVLVAVGFYGALSGCFALIGLQ
jgi:hypothetical protein